jgi:plasmid stabilization system protein ParE
VSQQGRYELVLRYARSRYLLRYRVTPDAVIVVRIFHGKERRPVW